MNFEKILVNPWKDPRYRPDFENISVTLNEEFEATQMSGEQLEILKDYETTMISTFRTLSSESSDSYYYKILEKKPLGKRSVSDVAWDVNRKFSRLYKFC